MTSSSVILHLSESNPRGAPFGANEAALSLLCHKKKKKREKDKGRGRQEEEGDSARGREREMRSGGGAAVQHGLSGSAAVALKRATALARRRSHAQITPLHVAAVMLSGGAAESFLGACLSSHPHVVSVSRSLEFCFGVALNRLPTSGVSLCSPSLSNALVAALKRAQSQQRRSGAEAAPPSVELEQLVISVLDDPSVSRVMREAGFSSTCVKKAMEERCQRWIPREEEEEELKFLMNVLISGKNALLVGDYRSREATVRNLTNRLRNGKVPVQLRSASLIELQLYPDDAEKRLDEMRRKIEAFLMPWSGGVIVYVGDLKWADFSTEALEREREPRVEYLVAEVGRLVREKGGRRVWIVAAASHETYLRCKARRPSMESLWAMQPVPVPSDGLSLSLHARSGGWDSRISRDFLQREEEGGKFICEEDRSSILPCWLTSEESDGGHTGMSEKRRKWSMNPRQDLEQDHLKRQCRPNPLFADGKCHRPGKSSCEESMDLWRRLSVSIPWQSETMRDVAKALINERLDGGKGAWLLLEGDDDLAKRRLPAAIGRDHILRINLRQPSMNSHSETILEALRNNSRCVVSIEEIHLADFDFLKFLAEISETGEARDEFGGSVASSDAVFILTTSRSPTKKSTESSARNFDLNVSAEEDLEEAVSAENTGGDLWSSRNFLGSVLATRIAMNSPHLLSQYNRHMF